MPRSLQGSAQEVPALVPVGRFLLGEGGRTLYCMAADGRRVDRLSAETLQAQGHFELPEGVTDCAITAGDARFVCVFAATKKLMSFDPKNGQVLESLDLPEPPAAVAASHRGQFVILAAETGALWHVNMPQIRGNTATAVLHQLTDTLPRPVDVAVSSNDAFAYVLCAGDSALHIYDLNSYAATSQVSTGGAAPRAVHISDQRAWVMHRNSNNISLLDLTDPHVEATIPLDAPPIAVFAP